MEIRSNYGLGHLEIAGWEIEGEAFSPSFRCDILAEAQGFQGKNTVHIDKQDLDRFLSDLEALDRTLQGEATLRSMSPDEFVLTIKPLDEKGHVLVQVTLRKYMSMYCGLEDYSVSLSYEIDQTAVSRLRSDCAAQAARLG